MKFENTEVWGFEHSLRGMRNPKNSWNRSDSHYGCDDEKYCDKCHDVGEYCFGYKKIKKCAQKINKNDIIYNVCANFFGYED